jgi:hypothetical protein
MTILGNKARGLALGVLCVCAPLAGAQRPIEAITGGGDKALLHPDGRWEYADPKKRIETPRLVPAAQAGEGPSQGGIFGVGRTVRPGDADYNRGSLSGKGR